MRFPRCDMRPSAEGFYCQCIGCQAISEKGGCVLVSESEGVYRYDGRTPHGGELAYLYFTDSGGSLTTREKASYVEIREMDNDGNVLHVDYGIVDDMGFTIKSNIKNQNDAEIRDITIIGAGQSGLFTAFQAGMYEASVRIIDSMSEPGGQLTALYPEKYIFDVPGFAKITAGDIVNYPGKLKLILTGFSDGAQAVRSAVPYIRPGGKMRHVHSTSLKVFGRG